MAITIVNGLTATQSEIGATFNNGTITNSTITGSPISGSTGSFTTVSASSTLTVDGNVSLGGTKFVVSADTGHALVGSNAPQNAHNSITPFLQVIGTNNSAASTGIFRYSADSGGTFFIGNKSRNASVGGQTSVQSGDLLVSLVGCGSDGTQMLNGGSVEVRSLNTASTNSVNTRMIISTRNGASSNVGIELNNTNSGAPKCIVYGTVSAPANISLAAKQVIVSADTGNLNIAASGGLSFTTVVSGQGAQAATLLTSPIAGNPSFWIPVRVNGTIRFIPSW